MTNTLNTPVEALESAYPLRVRRYELVRGSGGRGRSRGGLGIRRDTEVLAEGSTISLMGERQRRGPYGLFGGKSDLRAYTGLFEGTGSRACPQRQLSLRMVVTF